MVQVRLTQLSNLNHNRVGRWRVEDEMPIDGNTFMFVYDTTSHRGARYYPPQEWGYTGDTVFHYCGTDQAQKAFDEANAAIAALVKAYENYMYRRIVKSASEGRTLQQEFDARIATFRENDEKYQKLAANG